MATPRNASPQANKHRATLAQTRFLNDGGIYAQPLAAMYDAGTLVAPEDYQFQEYPKMLRISQGIKDIKCETETIKGKTIEWTETREVFEEIIVDSEEEEDRVLAGGKTSEQIEQDRQDLIARCRSQGMRVDPTWTMTRLKRELGETLNTEPVDEMTALERRLGDLQKMADMRAKIAALEAQLAPKGAVEHVEGEAPKRGRPRKVVEATESADSEARAA